MAQKEYQLLIQNEDPQLSSPIPSKTRRLPFLLAVLTSILTLSLAANALLFYRNLSLSFSLHAVTASPSDVTRYAKLARDVPLQFHQDAVYTSHNRTIANAAWDEVKIDHGVVALSSELAEKHDLMPSQPLPQDESKGIYLINAWHNLHCLRMLRIAIIEAHDQVPLSRNLGHLTHCLDSFRQDFMCDADDTPRWTGFDAFPTTGKGQIRMCRDWSKLEAWAKEHTACYSSSGNEVVGYPEAKHYGHCLEESE